MSGSSCMSICRVCCTIRLPPSSTLFPYTTLFRSLRLDLGDLRFEQLERLLGAGLDRRLALRGFRDRKSTRLNSSHLGTSYAVFCLKKKKRHIVSSTAVL